MQHALRAPVDTLIVGAGPAGAAAARLLAQSGRRVLLVDTQPIGRDKTCGDGLIPDAHRVLARLGLLEQVMAKAQRADAVACIGPLGGRLEVPGHLAVLPRRQLDEILVRGALATGAEFLQARFEAPIEKDGRVVGARLRVGDAVIEQRAAWTLLATGAVPKALQAAGMCTRHTPSGVALRGYIRAPALVGQITALEVVWNRAIRPGYAWIFPAPDGCFNIGVGVTDSHRVLAGKGRKHAINLRSMLDAFVAAYPPAQALLAQGEWVGELKGAPLRFSLEGARHSRPGLMVVGEAAGSTYALTGEGIGKAMETALLALGDDDAATRARYEAGLAALRPRYQLYARADRINRWPWLVDLLFWRVRRSPRLLQRMAGVLDETASPGNVVSLRGLRRLFLG